MQQPYTMVVTVKQERAAQHGRAGRDLEGGNETAELEEPEPSILRRAEDSFGQHHEVRPGAEAVPGPVGARQDGWSDRDDDDYDRSLGRLRRNESTRSAPVIVAQLVADNQAEMERMRLEAQHDAELNIRRQILATTVPAERVQVEQEPPSGSGGASDFFRRYKRQLFAGSFLLLVLVAVSAWLFGVLLQPEAEGARSLAPSLVPSIFSPSSQPTQPPTVTVPESEEPTTLSPSFAVVLSSEKPSTSPSSLPSQEPSVTYQPSFSPSASPQPTQSAAPTAEECLIDIDVVCDADIFTEQVESCEAPLVGVKPCRFDPTELTLLFNGGSCDQSDNRQFLVFSCEDFGSGPPVELGVEAFAVARSHDDGRVLSSATIPVGGLFNISSTSVEGSATTLPARINVTVYESVENQTTEHRLQQMSFLSACSSAPVELATRFDSMQFVAFRNDEQGLVSLFVTVQVTFSLSFTIQVAQRVRLESFQVISNLLNGIYNLTDRVNGDIVDRQRPAIVDVPVTFDLGERKRYTFLSQAVGIAQGGKVCMGFQFDSFFAGNPGPPVASPVPTVAPTVSLAPTPS